MLSVFGFTLLVLLHGEPGENQRHPSRPPSIIRLNGIELILWYSSENIEIDSSNHYTFKDKNGHRRPLADSLNSLAWLRLDHFLTTLKEKVAELPVKGLDPCIRVNSTPFHFSQPDSLTDMFEKTGVVLIGEVEAVTPGFFYDTPANLLSVRIKRVLQNLSGRRIEKYYHFSYLNARFNIGDLTVCNQNPSFDFEVWPGMEMMVFMWPAIEAEIAVVFTSPHYLFVQRPDGSIRGPAWFQMDQELGQVRNMQELEEKMAEKLSNIKKLAVQKP